MKRIISFCAAMLIMLTLSLSAPFTVFGAGDVAQIIDTDGTTIVNTYDNFNTALGVLGEGQTLKLLQDAEAGTTTAQPPWKNRSYTVDLNGFTITTVNTRFLNLASDPNTAAPVTYTIKNGKIIQSNRADVTIFVRANMKVILEDIEIEQTVAATYGVLDFRRTGSATKDGTAVLNNVKITTVGNVFRRTNTGNKAVLSINSSDITCGSGYSVFDSDWTWTTAEITVNNTVFKSAGTAFSSTDFANVTVAPGGYASASKGGTAIDGALNSENKLQRSVVLAAVTNALYIESNPLQVDVFMTEGASIRLNEVSGIRYYTNVDVEKIRSLVASGATVTMGTLIAPADLLGDNELTLELDEDLYAAVPYDVDKLSTYFAEGFVGSLVGIKETSSYSAVSGNVTREFVGRGYVSVEKDGKTVVSYASYAGDDASGNTRSLKTIALALKADTESYNALSDDKKLLVDNWAAAVE